MEITTKLKPFAKNNRFLMLAFDHRDSLVKIRQEAHLAADADSLTKLKQEIIEATMPSMTGALIDDEYGLPAYANQTKPFLLPMEVSGYEQVGDERKTELRLSAAQIKELGATGAKLLLYYNPDGATATHQRLVAARALTDAQDNDLPFFLEVVFYNQNSVAEATLKMVSQFLADSIVPDVWKLEYPGSAAACQDLSKLADATPWILLSRGVKFDQFSDYLAVSLSNGGSGCLVGRALWQEIAIETEITKSGLELLAKRAEQLNRLVLG